MKRGIIGFLILIIGIAVLAIIMVLVQTKLIAKSTHIETNVDLGNGQTAPIPLNPRDVQNKVNDLQNQLQQKQNESLGVK